MELLREFIAVVFTDQFISALVFIAKWAPVWLPLILLYVFWSIWVRYVRSAFINKTKWKLLEVRLPQDITRSPLAMELFLNSLRMGFGEDHFVEKYWQGSVRFWSSLELVSVEGDVRFILWINAGSQSLFESQIYAQYPDAEIVEVPDYTKGMEFGKDDWTLWGAEFKLTKPDPYPIMTYVDYNLDKDPKEENKIDPITPVIEWLGSLGPGEQGWIQILVRQHEKEDKAPGFLGSIGLKKVDNWVDDAKKEIEKIKKDGTITSGGEDSTQFVSLTPGQRDVVAALERSISKAAFDVGIRGIYLAKKDKFNPANIGGLLGSVKQYSTNHLNGFKPAWTTGFKVPWRMDPTGRRVKRKKRIVLDAYKRRSYFHAPYKRKHFVLNTEELATIYHFPGRVSTTPTFKRIESRKSEPPVNLPLE